MDGAGGSVTSMSNVAVDEPAAFVAVNVYVVRADVPDGTPLTRPVY